MPSALVFINDEDDDDDENGDGEGQDEGMVEITGPVGDDRPRDSVMTHCGWCLSPRSDCGNCVDGCGAGTPALIVIDEPGSSAGDETDVAPCLNAARRLGGLWLMDGVAAAG
jgi:hypothetical protein